MKALVILIPTMGHVATEFMASMVGATQALRARGIPFAVKTHEFSDIVMSRNYLLSFFLSQPYFSHALLLDSDLGFPPEQLFRLIDFRQPFVAAPYPRRRLSPQRFHDLVMANAALPADRRQSPADLAARSYGYVLQPGPPEGRSFTPRSHGEFRTVPAIGLGFALIAREVPETMASRGPARPLPRQGGLPGYADAPRFHDFCSHVLDPRGELLYGEDQSFCQRWVYGCGGDVWIDTRARVTHYGQMGFLGNFAAEGDVDGESCGDA